MTTPDKHGQWQPISTAPKDGTRVLLFLDRSGGTVCGRYDDNKYAKKPNPYWKTDFVTLWGIRDARDYPPSHWMPLPEPPK